MCSHVRPMLLGAGLCGAGRAHARMFAPQLPLTLAPERTTFLQTTDALRERERETVNVCVRESGRAHVSERE